jgi:hypothetical protein
MYMFRIFKYFWIAAPVVALLFYMAMPAINTLRLMEHHGGVEGVYYRAFKMPSTWADLQGSSVKRKIQGEFRKVGVHLDLDKISLLEDFSGDESEQPDQKNHSCRGEGVSAKVLIFAPFSVTIPLLGSVTFLPCFTAWFESDPGRGGGD